MMHFIDVRALKQVAEDGFDENNLVHSERFQVYKVRIRGQNGNRQNCFRLRTAVLD